MDEISTFIWGLSIAINIIIILVALPMLILICCCCRKSSTIKKDVASIMANHNILQDQQNNPNAPYDMNQQYIQQPIQQPMLPNMQISNRKVLTE